MILCAEEACTAGHQCCWARVLKAPAAELTALAVHFLSNLQLLPLNLMSLQQSTNHAQPASTCYVCSKQASKQAAAASLAASPLTAQKIGQILSSLQLHLQLHLQLPYRALTSLHNSRQCQCQPACPLEAAAAPGLPWPAAGGNKSRCCLGVLAAEHAKDKLLCFGHAVPCNDSSWPGTQSTAAHQQAPLLRPQVLRHACSASTKLHARTCTCTRKVCWQRNHGTQQQHCLNLTSAARQLTNNDAQRSCSER